LSAERPWLAALALLLALFSTGARADVFTAGEFRISRDASEDTYQLAARLPASPAASLDIGWPAGCVQTRAQRQYLGNQAHLVFEARCDRPLGREDFITTPWRLDGARIRGEFDGVPVSATLPRADGGMQLPVVFGPRADRSFGELAPEFLWQGMLHIWIGWDHLAFVLCLCMLARGVRLLGLVTAFTLGHSLSLGLAFFGVLSLPIQPVEAVIALSIVLIAREALRARGRTYEALTRPLLVATGFGLVHGLGLPARSVSWVLPWASAGGRWCFSTWASSWASWCLSCSWSGRSPCSGRCACRARCARRPCTWRAASASSGRWSGSPASRGAEYRRPIRDRPGSG
jgi:hypothetical protein